MRSLACAVVLVALLGVASAVHRPRFPPSFFSDLRGSITGEADTMSNFDWIDVFGGKTETLLHAKRGHGGGSKYQDVQGNTIFASIYSVPANLHDEFIDRWRDLERGASKQRGLKVYDLKKTAHDNLYFMCYGEWETFEDFQDYLTSKEAMDWKDFLAKNDIEVDMYPLGTPIDEEEEYRRRNQVQASSPFERRGGKRERMAHVLFKFHVPPSVHDDFIDAWRDVAQLTYGEEGNRNYQLRRIGTKNHHFMVYGTWDSYRDFQDHITSRTFKRLQGFTADNQILWKMEPLIKLGEQSE